MIARLQNTRGRATGLAMLLAGPALAGCAAQPPDWAQRESDLRAEGLMRTDYVPADLPFTKDDLIDNFATLAFGITPDAQSGLGRSDAAMLMKWRAPLRWRIVATTPRPEDFAHMRRVMGRIDALTPLAPREATSADDQDAPDLSVVILNAKVRAEGLAAQDETVSLTSNPGLAEWLGDDGAACRHFQIRGKNGPRKAATYVRDELDGLSRRACIENAAVIPLGFAASDKARPSVWSGDGEFALMTRHDELLLQILYDPRLKTGMSAEQAMPIVRRIVAEMDLREGADPIRVASAEAAR